MNLSRQSIALVLTTKNKKAKQHIHPKHKTEKMPLLTKQSTSWFGMYFTASGQET